MGKKRSKHQGHGRGSKAERKVKFPKPKHQALHNIAPKPSGKSGKKIKLVPSSKSQRNWMFFISLMLIISSMAQHLTNKEQENYRPREKNKKTPLPSSFEHTSQNSTSTFTSVLNTLEFIINKPLIMHAAATPSEYNIPNSQLPWKFTGRIKPQENKKYGPSANGFFAFNSTSEKACEGIRKRLRFSPLKIAKIFQSVSADSSVAAYIEPLVRSHNFSIELHPNLTAVSGFYMPTTNTIVLPCKKSNIDNKEATILHEAWHGANTVHHSGKTCNPGVTMNSGHAAALLKHPNNIIYTIRMNKKLDNIFDQGNQKIAGLTNDLLESGQQFIINRLPPEVKQAMINYQPIRHALILDKTNNFQFPLYHKKITRLIDEHYITKAYFVNNLKEQAPLGFLLDNLFQYHARTSIAEQSYSSQIVPEQLERFKTDLIRIEFDAFIRTLPTKLIDYFYEGWLELHETDLQVSAEQTGCPLRHQRP